MSLDQPFISWEKATAAVDPNQQLIARCLYGDEAAHEQLYDQYAGMIYRLVYGMLQHQEDAEEVLQDSFEYAFRRLRLYDPSKSAFKTWLYRIAISRCRNKRRRKWLPTFSLSQLVNSDIEDKEMRAPDDLAHLNERQQQVWGALQALSPKLRETAYLRYYEGLTYGEIGNILQIPAKTAESRMRLAHKALRESLHELVAAK